MRSCNLVRSVIESFLINLWLYAQINDKFEIRWTLKFKKIKLIFYIPSAISFTNINFNFSSQVIFKNIKSAGWILCFSTFVYNKVWTNSYNYVTKEVKLFERMSFQFQWKSSTERATARSSFLHRFQRRSTLKIHWNTINI